MKWTNSFKNTNYHNGHKKKEKSEHPIFIKEIELLIKLFPQRKLPNTYLRKRNVTIILKLFQSTEEITLPNLFYEARKP